MTDIVRVGVVGAGNISHNAHLPAYKSVTNAKVVAICDLDIERAKKAAEDFDIPHYYDSVTEMLANEDIDAVDICTWNSAHAPVAIEAANAGKHVICEKPLTVSVENAEKIAAAIKANGVKFMLAVPGRFGNKNQYIRKMLDSGELGEVVASFFFRGGGTPLWSYENWLLDREKGGGALFDQHVHDVDMINFLFGMPEKVSTVGKTMFEKSAYDTLTTNYIYKNGMPCNTQNDWTLTSPYFYQDFRVNFTKGTVVKDTAGFHIYRKEGENEEYEVPSKNPYYEETKFFAQCILDGKPITYNMPEDSKNTIRIVLAERESADKSGELVCVK